MAAARVVFHKESRALQKFLTAKNAGKVVAVPLEIEAKELQPLFFSEKYKIIFNQTDSASYDRPYDDYPANSIESKNKMEVINAYRNTQLFNH